MNKLRDLPGSFGEDPSSPEKTGAVARSKPKRARSPDCTISARLRPGAAVGWLEHDQRSRLVVDRNLNVLWANAAAILKLRRPMPVLPRRGQLRFSDDVDPGRCREFVLAQMRTSSVARSFRARAKAAA